jgi:CRP/FNR family transcriptional regulator, cyclic AMP receptor protein
MAGIQGRDAPASRIGVAGLLARVGLFAGLAEEDCQALAERVRRRRYRKGTTLFVEGDPGTCLYVVESGHVEIRLTSPDGKELVVATRGPGEFFGDMALLDGAPRSADAVAADDCWLLLLQREDFVHFLEAHPKAAVRLVEVLSRRLRESMRQQQEATFLDVSGRVASALLRLAEEDGIAAEDGSGAIAVCRSLTQVQLAGMVGVTRESVNKWIGFFQRRGDLRWEKGRLTILRPDELRKRLY